MLLHSTVDTGCVVYDRNLLPTVESTNRVAIRLHGWKLMTSLGQACSEVLREVVQVAIKLISRLVLGKLLSLRKIEVCLNLDVNLQEWERN